MPKAQKKPKPVYKEDDGRTYFDMNVEGFRWYKGRDRADFDITRKERRALMRAGFFSALKTVGIIAAGLTIGICLIYLWLL